VGLGRNEQKTKATPNPKPSTKGTSKARIARWKTGSTSLEELIKGTVRLEVVVSPNGKAKFTQVLGGNPLLARAAVEAIEGWKWGLTQQDTREFIEFNFNP
jgi:outer membrane biosynthesis protein TonB